MVSWWEERACHGVNSLFLLSFLQDEGDELLHQQDEDEEPNNATHDSQDDECHCVVHFFHCMARVGREGTDKKEQESYGGKHHSSPRSTEP